MCLRRLLLQHSITVNKQRLKSILLQTAKKPLCGNDTFSIPGIVRYYSVRRVVGITHKLTWHYRIVMIPTTFSRVFPFKNTIQRLLRTVLPRGNGRPVGKGALLGSGCLTVQVVWGRRHYKQVVEIKPKKRWCGYIGNKPFVPFVFNAVSYLNHASIPI